MSFVVGLGIVFIAPLVLVALIFTILLSPVSLLGIFALLAAWVVGLVALSIEIGKKLSQALDQNWPVPILAGVGMFILSLFLMVSAHCALCRFHPQVHSGTVGYGRCGADPFRHQGIS